MAVGRIATKAAATMRFIDIGANLTDRMYSGEYNGSNKHPADLQAVIARAQEAGVEKMIVTGGSLEESRQAVKLAEQHEQLVATVGCHPTRCGEFEADNNDSDAYFDGLLNLAQSNKGKVVAVGEIGLDYDRTKFCEADMQQKYFLKQLNLSEATRLPLFLHCRAAATDLVKILTEHREKVRTHSNTTTFNQVCTLFWSVGQCPHSVPPDAGGRSCSLF